MEKKAVSEVITAVLLVLLAIAAVVIVWGVVRGMLSTPVATSGCASIQLSITNVVPTSGANTVTVKREPNLGAAVDLVKIKFVLEDATHSEVVEKPSTLVELDDDTYAFTEAFTLTKVSVYPVISSDGQEKLCGKSTSWTAAA